MTDERVVLIREHFDGIDGHWIRLNRALDAMSSDDFPDGDDLDTALDRLGAGVSQLENWLENREKE